jgi:hypothetical protein
MKANYERENFEKLVKESYSWTQLISKCEKRTSGKAFRAVKKYCNEYDLDTSHFTGHAWRQDRKPRPNSVPLELYLSGEIPTTSTHLKKRLLKEGLLYSRCYVCGITEWCGLPAPLQLDHTNGNCLDNSLENLRVLCPNCHAQTDTYAGKNIGKKYRTKETRHLRPVRLYQRTTVLRDKL